MIRIFSQKQFRELTPNGDHAIISIQSPTIKRVFFQQGTEFDVDPGWGPTLVLRFHDVLDDELDSWWKTFTPAQAEQTLDFIEANHTRNFDIHCDAGMSRSVAVGAFMADNLNMNMEIHSGPWGRQSMNIHVYNLLRRDIMRRMGDEFE